MPDLMEHDAHARRMDRKYGRVRHVYDLTRKYFLFGRDRALDAVKEAAPSSIVEIGCGTGRNIARLARDNPSASVFGVDISEQMLLTAKAKTSRFTNVRLARADACALDTARLFGATNVDAVLMSFSLSMIPDRKAALGRAIKALARGGLLVIVDFGDFNGYGRLGPLAIRSLAAADAPPVPDLRGLLDACVANDKRFSVESEMALGGYYVIATVRHNR
jgi:S-adenosylmethionine-diacylgycerolhomoserine-N-methlytransferase|nr:class I SAM-dependent methyltransferase [Neorhizobium tomejilense]